MKLIVFSQQRKAIGNTKVTRKTFWNCIWTEPGIRYSLTSQLDGLAGTKNVLMEAAEAKT